MAADLIWQVDDASYWHEVTKTTLAACSFPWRAEYFLRGSSMLYALESNPPQHRPAIILMDFFLPGERGDHLTREAREILADEPCTIVGFSSMRSGSQAIVDAGGTLILPKYDRAGVNEHLQKWLAENCPD